MTAPEYWWAAEAAGRHRGGDSLAALGRAYGVHADTVKAVLRRQGVDAPLPRRRVRQPWAAAAAVRYVAGESVHALAAAYGTTDYKMRKALEGEGVTLRDASGAASVRNVRARQAHLVQLAAFLTTERRDNL